MKTPRTRLPAALSLATASALLLSGCAATTVPTSAATSVVAASSAAGFWDSSSVHSISVEVEDGGLEEIWNAYEQNGEKVWAHADVTIDGVVYADAGIKLKGNSSLKSASADDDQSTVPWIIRLDKFVDDQSLDGITELVVRGNSTSTALNEAVALDLLELSGLASEQAAATRFTIDGSTSLRLTVENPSDGWNDATVQATALYKAESGGDYSYRGDDPASYDDVFDQEAGEEDLAPLISFLQFINESDDATFAAELSTHLDVDAFATYLAFQELVDNFDDIDGPGNNSYLAFDADTGVMTVVSWDLNLAFGASPDGGGGGGAGGGGGGGGGGGPMQDRADAPAGAGEARGAGAGGGSNVLAERFLADNAFAALYQAELDRLAQLFYDDGNAQSILTEWSGVLASDASDLVEPATIAAETDDLSETITGLADERTEG